MEGLPPIFAPFIEPHRYKIAYGGRGSGKSWSIARLLIEIARRMPARILCGRELQTSIKDSVLQLLSDTIDRNRYQKEFDVQKQTIVHKRTGATFLFYGIKNNITKIKSLEGVDICWIEEAENVSQESWDVLIPTIRKERSEIWVSFNPKNALDDTYVRFIKNPQADSVVLRVNYTDNPHFPETLRIEMEACKERNYDLYRHIWLGEPVADSEHAIIKPSWIEAAVDAHIALNLPPAGSRRVGFDIADEGEDSSAATSTYGYVVEDCVEWRGCDVLDSADKVYLIATDYHADTIIYDSIGMGAGVKAHYARVIPERGAKLAVEGFNAGGAIVEPWLEYMDGKTNRDMFSNIKAQAWWGLRDRFFYTWRAVNGKIPEMEIDEDKLISLSSSITKLDDLMAELSRPYVSYDKNGRAMVERKEDMRKRGIPSTNLADSLVMTFVPQDNSAAGLLF